MVSKVQSRPSHYDALGVSPSASAEEICRAFSRKMGLFGAQSVASRAELSVAFETLRNPARRREYDRTIGLVQASEPRKWVVSGSLHAGPALLGADWRRPRQSAGGHAPKAATDTSTAAGPPAEPHIEPAPTETAEARLGTFIASSLREPAEPAPAPPLPPDAAQDEPGDDLVREIERILAPRRGIEATPKDDNGAFEWKRAAAVVAAVLTGAGALGVYAGMDVSDAEQVKPASRGVTVGLPAARPTEEATRPRPAPVARSYQAPQQVVSLEPRSVPGTRQAPPRQQEPSRFAETAIADGPAAAAELASNAPPVDAALASTGVPDTAEATPVSAAAAVPAKLPLSNATIASTIRRIGYPCGSVVSTSAAGPGVFSVTCSSGDTYRASPIRGRYHFRKARAH